MDSKSNSPVKANSPLAFALPILFCPLLVLAWLYGGWAIILAPVFGYIIITFLDFLVGENKKELISLDSKDFSYKIILYIWPFLQILLLIGTLTSVFIFDHLSIIESIALILVQGMVTGAVGITFAHELMHQRTKLERFLSDLLMGMAFYGHFRTEHVLVHHRHVGTMKDTVTARFDESFYSFFLRVLPGCFFSAWNVEKERLEARGKSLFSFSNPFYTYFFTAVLFLVISFFIGGLFGIVAFLLQALIAVLHLEVINYIEHYGLVRKKISQDKYETTKSFHSWNANHAASNLLLINLQKHSDHHARPNKSYPVLSAYDESSAPQLPFGYPLMVVLTLIPFLWKKIMNPRVLEWREQFYPEVYRWGSSD